MSDEYDVLIVGARVAGAIVAALLGDAGYKVLLVDRATFPSPTLSTHFFRGSGLLAVLKRLKVLEQVLALGSPPFTQHYNYTNGGEQPTIEACGPSEIGYDLSVRRKPLDHLLVQRALATQRVELRERTRVTELHWEDGRVVGARLANKAEQQSVRAKIVVGADGRHSFVARAVAAANEEAAPPYRALYYSYVQGFASPHGHAPDGAEFSFLEDEIAYVFPSDAGIACVALSINLEDFAWLKSAPAERYRARIAHHKGIAARFAASLPISSVMGQAPEPNYVRTPVGPGWALVGDAGMHQDPFAGWGMDMASTHAAYLAEALVGWLDHSVSEAEALATYHQQRNAHGLETYRRTVRIAQDVRQRLAD